MARKVISGGITGLSVRYKDTLSADGGVAISPWYALEPNEYSDYGGEVTTVTRNPISRSRQRKKGTVTDFDASGGFSHDFTQHQLTKLLQTFFYAAAFEKPTTAALNSASIPVTAVTAATGYAFDNAPDLGFVVGHLVLASGFSNAANNGLKVVTAISATGIDVDGVADEAAPPADAELRVVGFEFGLADATLAVTASAVTLGATVADFTDLGLRPGEWVFIGGDGVGAQFNGNVPGYARIGLDAEDVAASTIVFDKTTFTPTASDGTGKNIRMFFGTFLRNMTEDEIQVAGDVNRFVMDMERTLGRDSNGIQSEVLVDVFANALTYTQPLSEKITVDMTFVALDEQKRNGTMGLMPGVREKALGEAAYNTSTCLYRTRMSLLDPDTLNPSALFAYVNSIELTVENNVSSVKAQGAIGGIDTVEGDFAVGGSAEVYFSTVAATEAVREYSDVTFDTILAQDNVGFVFDVPILGLGDGRLNVSKDEAITVPLSMAAFENDGGYTLSYTNFAYLPDVAMPA